jgi:CDP-glucose 4,6-dehydratase
VECRQPALEDVGVSESQWRGRRVLVTGHTGFKGAWLSLWLVELGARVTGFSLAPPTQPSLFELARVAEGLKHAQGDVRDRVALRQAFQSAEPELVVHLAAQSLVRESYRDPVQTYETNLLGTVNLLEQCRASPSVRAVLVVTSDKCYQNGGADSPYRESDPLGGSDPYSSSKAAAELAAAAYRSSFFATSGPALATARAGNVIGGGDFAAERLIPDLVRAFMAGERPVVRNPHAVRPWQHVLEPLSGYLLLAQRLLGGERSAARAWNFGPELEDAKPVAWMVQRALSLLGAAGPWVERPEPLLPEAANLRLDSRDARERLGWEPRLRVETALEWTIGWYRDWQSGKDPRTATLDQIRRHGAPALRAT